MKKENDENDTQDADNVDFASLNGVYDDDFSVYMNPPTD